MNLFNRLSDLLALDFAAFGHSTSEPEQMLKELTEGLNAARRYAALVIAREYMLRKEIEAEQVEANYWSREAMAPRVMPCHESLDRAVVRSQACEEVLALLALEHSDAQETAGKLRTYVRALEAYVTFIRRHAQAYNEREKIAAARRDLDRLIGEFAPQQAADA